jgi:hypothetical protein
MVNDELKTNVERSGRNISSIIPYVRSQWPRGLRHGCAAVRLLGLRVRIPPGHGCLSVLSAVCFQVEISATGRSLDQRNPTACGVSECDCEASIMRRPWPTRSCCAIGKLNSRNSLSLKSTVTFTEEIISLKPLSLLLCQGRIIQLGETVGKKSDYY